MMPRTIVHIQENSDGQTRFRLESPNTYAKAGMGYPLLSKASEPPFRELRMGDPIPDIVRSAGQQLFKDISVHPAVALALTAALQQKDGGYSPIYFRLDDATPADDLPWEAFHDATQEFLALDKRWPIVRVRDVTEAESIPVYQFYPPLRIVAVLSAAGATANTRVPAALQWEKIHQTLLKVPGSLPLKLTVLVGEKSLRDNIRGLGIVGVDADLIADKDDLLQRIKDASPHILHFFCHGAVGEIPHLQIGRFTDWEAEQDGTIALTARELRQRADPKKTIWLVTLNCCDSAVRARDARGLASSLVAAGFPAALGMREGIDVQHANLLCEKFYPAILDLINSVPDDGSGSEIEWACALHNCRSALADECKKGLPLQEAARGCKYWTIPALYTRRESFMLQRFPVGAATPEKQNPVPLAAFSAAKQNLIDFLRTLQKQRTKAAEDFKDLPKGALEAILKDYDNEIETATVQLSHTK